MKAETLTTEMGMDIIMRSEWSSYDRTCKLYPCSVMLCWYAEKMGVDQDIILDARAVTDEEARQNIKDAAIKYNKHLIDDQHNILELLICEAATNSFFTKKLTLGDVIEQQEGNTYIFFVAPYSQQEPVPFPVPAWLPMSFVDQWPNPTVVAVEISKTDHRCEISVEGIPVRIKVFTFEEAGRMIGTWVKNAKEGNAHYPKLSDSRDVSEPERKMRFNR